MAKVKIITDSCSDLSPELLCKYDIDYVKMSTVEDGIESPALLEWSRDDSHKLYEAIRNGKRITTAQVSVEEFTKVFEKYINEGKDIVYIGCSSKQSGSVNTAVVIKQKMKEKYPSSVIYCIDSLGASYGEGILAIEGAKMSQEGATAEEINTHILKIRKKVNQYVTVHTLDYLKRAGRVSATSAFFGNLMGVKPILISDVNGTQVAFKKVKGRNASFQEIVSLLKESIEFPEEQTIYIAHADCKETEVSHLKEIIKSEINCKDVYIGGIGPIIGASIGPDAIGVWAFGKEVTFSAENI